MSQILLSLHGFHSSPNSLKIKQVKSYLEKNHPEIIFIAPQLPASPAQMWKIIEEIFVKYSSDRISVIGRSLGGYLAAKVTEVYGSKVILVNPAVSPYRLIKNTELQIHPYTDETYLIDETYKSQLEDLEVIKVSKSENIWVFLQKGDTVLDHREALIKYKDCKITCENGGDHSFIGFDRYLEEIMKFLF